jgi:PHD/YefM family antitoxin component YafN of YafNO toxin-antitoxin module
MKLASRVLQLLEETGQIPDNLSVESLLSKLIDRNKRQIKRLEGLKKKSAQGIDDAKNSAKVNNAIRDLTIITKQNSDAIVLLSSVPKDSDFDNMSPETLYVFMDKAIEQANKIDSGINKLQSVAETSAINMEIYNDRVKTVEKIKKRLTDVDLVSIGRLNLSASPSDIKQNLDKMNSILAKADKDKQNILKAYFDKYTDMMYFSSKSVVLSIAAMVAEETMSEKIQEREEWESFIKTLAAKLNKKKIPASMSADVEKITVDIAAMKNNIKNIRKKITKVSNKAQVKREALEAIKGMYIAMGLMDDKIAKDLAFLQEIVDKSKE